MTSIHATVVSALLLSTALPGAARAEGTPPATEGLFGYAFNIAIRGWITPNYEGGKRFGPAPGGSLAVSKPADFDKYAAPDDAASFAIVSNDKLSLGAAASLRENRGNNRELQGLRSIGWSAQGGAFANYWPTPAVRLHVEALKGVTSQYGLLVNTSADYVANVGPWRLATGPRFSWGDKTWNNRYFGVTPTEAKLSPYIHQAYFADAGPHFYGWEAAAEYKWRRHVRLTFDVRYHHLLGDDAKSPLVRQLGTPEQISASTGVRFMFPG